MSGGPRPEGENARRPAAPRRKRAMVTTLVVVLALVIAGSVAAVIALRSEPTARVTIEATIRTSQALNDVRENASIGPSGGTDVGGNVVVPLRTLPGPLRAPAETSTAPDPETAGPATTPTSDETGSTTSGTTTTTEPTTSQSTTTPSETSSPTTAPTSTTGTSPTTTGPTTTTATDSSEATTLQSDPDRSVPPDAVPALALPPVAEVPTEEREQLYCRVLAETELTEAYVLPPCQVVQGPADDDAPSSEPTEATAAQAPARDDQPTDAEGTGTGEATVVPFVQQGLVGPGRSHVPAEMAAERLRAQLAEVRSRPQREAQGPAGQQPKVREELLGMQASIDVHADGLAGEPLSLFWRLSAAPGADVLPATWVTPVLASQLQPETNSEVAALNFWIPLPRNPGPFVLDVFVVREADGELLGSQRLEPVA